MARLSAVTGLVGAPMFFAGLSVNFLSLYVPARNLTIEKAWIVPITSDARPVIVTITTNLAYRISQAGCIKPLTRFPTLNAMLSLSAVSGLRERLEVTKNDLAGVTQARIIQPAISMITLWAARRQYCASLAGNLALYS